MQSTLKYDYKSTDNIKIHISQYSQVFVRLVCRTELHHVWRPLKMDGSSEVPVPLPPLIKPYCVCNFALSEKEVQSHHREI